MKATELNAVLPSHAESWFYFCDLELRRVSKDPCASISISAWIKKKLFNLNEIWMAKRCCFFIIIREIDMVSIFI